MTGLQVLVQVQPQHTAKSKQTNIEKCKENQQKRLIYKKDAEAFVKEKSKQGLDGFVQDKFKDQTSVDLGSWLRRC